MRAFSRIGRTLPALALLFSGLATPIIADDKMPPLPRIRPNKLSPIEESYKLNITQYPSNQTNFVSHNSMYNACAFGLQVMVPVALTFLFEKNARPEDRIAQLLNAEEQINASLRHTVQNSAVTYRLRGNGEDIALAQKLNAYSAFTQRQGHGVFYSVNGAIVIAQGCKPTPNILDYTNARADMQRILRITIL